MLIKMKKYIKNMVEQLNTYRFLHPDHLINIIMIVFIYLVKYFYFAYVSLTMFWNIIVLVIIYCLTRIVKIEMKKYWEKHGISCCAQQEKALFLYNIDLTIVSPLNYYFKDQTKQIEYYSLGLGWIKAYSSYINMNNNQGDHSLDYILKKREVLYKFILIDKEIWQFIKKNKGLHFNMRTNTKNI